MAKFAGDIFEQRRQIHFLLIISAHSLARRLADNRDDGLMIHFRVVKSVEQMNRARPGRGETNADFAGEFRMAARHERGHFLVARLNEINFVSDLFPRVQARP